MKYVCVWPLLLLVATGINVIETRKQCKGPRNITWEVLNFKSIIKWRETKCAPVDLNYTVETCLEKKKCSWKNNVGWVEHRCYNEPLRPMLRWFTCNVDLDPELPAQTMLRVCRRSSKTRKEKVCGKYGKLSYTLFRKSVFTEPNISSPNEGASAHQASITIQEPTGKYLRYLDKIQYEVIAVELHKITNGTKCPQPDNFESVKEHSVNSAYLKKSCSETPTEEDHAVSHWSLDDLTPNTTYCVYARYDAPITKNSNGPSQVGMLQVRTAGYPWQPSTAFIAALSVGIMIVIIVGITITYRLNRFYKSIKIDPMFPFVDVCGLTLPPSEGEPPCHPIGDVNNRVRNNRCDVLNHEYHHLDQTSNAVEAEGNMVVKKLFDTSSPGASGTMSEGIESSVGTYIKKEGRTQCFSINSGDVENTDAAALQQETSSVVTERQLTDHGEIDTCSGFNAEVMNSSVESESMPLLQNFTPDTSEMTENQATPTVNTRYWDADHFSK